MVTNCGSIYNCHQGQNTAHTIVNIFLVNAEIFSINFNAADDGKVITLTNLQSVHKEPLPLTF